MDNLVAQNLAQYHITNFRTIGDVTYVGKITAGGAWYVMRVDEGVTPSAVTYCKGDSGYDFSDPASLTYDTFDAIF
jgi:hypothetical protein